MANMEVFEVGGISNFVSKVKTWCTSMFAKKQLSTTVELPANSWVNDEITVQCQAVRLDSDVVVSPVPAQVSAFSAAGIICTSQGNGTLTFAKQNPVSLNLMANVLVLPK